MALATKCPHCNTIFRVAADQLKLRGGIVRCGACHEVFDGNAALVEPAAKPTPVIPDVAAEVAAAAPHAPAAASAPAEPPASPYVHGGPVDFELDLEEEPAAASQAPAEASPASVDEPSHADVPSPADAQRPAVWRTAAAEAAPPADTRAAEPPSPDDIARAAVARAFAAVVPPPAHTEYPAAQPSPDTAPAPAATAPASAPLSAAEPWSVAGESSDAAAPSPDAAEPSPDAVSPADAVAGQSPDATAPSPDATAPSRGTVASPDAAATPAAADEPCLPWDEAPAAEAPLSSDAAPSADGTAPAAAIETVDDEHVHPDGRIEPSLDTPQEHVVAAALDDAHHFEDLPADEPPAPEEAIADASASAASPLEPSLGDESWSAAGGIGGEPAPAEEPWSLSEPDPVRDDTALHAVAAVNTDAPDDGESLPADEPPAEEARATSRRERALKRAKSRRDASGPVQPSAAEDTGEGSTGFGDAEATASDDAKSQAAARMRALAGVDEAAEDLDHSDLSFVKRVDRSQKYGKAIKLTMAFGIPVLLAGLVLQAATTFRDTLAANYPQLKPALAAICQPLGCKIALPAQLDALSIEQGELASMADNTFSFSTVLRNQSKTVQAWPHIELTLNDNADKPVLRRVFAPREYLPSPADAEKGFGPRSEQSIKLYFELKDLKASGYHIAIFYP